MTEQKPELKLVKDFSKIGKREQFAAKYLEGMLADVYKLKAIHSDFYVECHLPLSTDKILIECKQFLSRAKVYEAITELLSARLVLSSKFDKPTNRMIILCQGWWLNVSHFKLLKLWDIDVMQLRKNGEIRKVDETLLTNE